MAPAAFSLNPGTLTLKELRALLESKQPVILDPGSHGAIDRSAAVVQAVIDRGETAYGINTGFGALAKTHIKDDQLTELQRRLVVSHAAGTGEALNDNIVRAILILKINGLGYELEGNVMRIAPTAVLQAEAEQRQKLEQARALSVPLLTVIKRLSYANAGTVAGLLQARGGVLSQRGSVIIDGRTNTLIIKELPAVMDTVIAVIENLDIAEPQVMIEARIVETRKQFTRTLGIQWGLDGSASPVTGNPTGLVFPATVDGSGGVNLITGGSNGIVSLALGSLAGTFNLDVTLQAAENEGLVNILSAPKVATLNNEQAEIQSGFQIPIQTVSNNTVSVQFVNATLRLQVTPQVTAEGTVLMDINIQKRNPEFALQVAGATAAPISTQEARTRVIVRDGGTTVIGGIYEVSTNEGEDRVPGLANIPILGHLFKNRRREDQNTELLIFITPRVMRL